MNTTEESEFPSFTKFNFLSWHDINLPWRPPIFSVSIPNGHTESGRHRESHEESGETINLINMGCALNVIVNQQSSIYDSEVLQLG